MIRSTSRRTRLVTGASLAAVSIGAMLSACSSGGGANTSNTITVWSEENQTDRVQATQKLADQFTAKTGIKVKIVGIDENQFSQLVTSAAAAGKLPDVIGALPLAGVRELATNKLVDTASAKAVIDNLGANTFSQSALALDSDQGTPLAVPSDGWAQLLIYRKDLFDKAHLPVPNTFANIEHDAQVLNKNGMAGITLSTDPADSFTSQTFEDLALANNCQLVDGSGKVQLNSKACVDTFQFYGDLVHKYSVPGTQTVDTTRATYFAGKSAMTVWSSFILDEMAGLRNDALPNCPQCKTDKTFLSENSGIITAIQGPDGTQPAQFGELGSWAITPTANKTDAQKFVEYMMSDGYLGWLGLAPEGKFPTRKGDASDPAKFTTGWNSLPAGVDVKKPLGDLYPASVIDQLRSSPDTFQRWGITQGQGALVGAILAQLPVPKAIAALAGGQVDANGAAQQAQQGVTTIQGTLK